MPMSLRRFLTEQSAHIMFWWSTDTPPRFPDVHDAPASGSFELNLECLRNLTDGGKDWMFGDEPDDVRERWVRSWAVIHAANGDMLALDVTEDANDPPVIYLNHEAHEAIWTVSPSWDTFIHEWARLGCVGPEEWNLEPFCQRRGDAYADNAEERPFRLDSRCANARLFRAHFGMAD